MAKRKEDEKFLDVNASMKGTLTFSDPVNLRINGKFEGTLEAKGSLIVGERAVVSANIEGEAIIISGLVKGKIRATKIITLTSTANVYGDIETPRLSIQEGAVLNSTCKMSPERFTLPELADYLSVETTKVLEWINSGKLPAQKEGSEFIFDRREVELWVAQNR
jgi:excisionase family DNA binding protein